MAYEVIRVERDVDMHKIYDRVKESRSVYKIFKSKKKARKFIKDNWSPASRYELGNKIKIE